MSKAVLESGRVAVVTGAASGIGLATCKHLARLGMHICMADVAESLGEAAEAVAAEAPKGAESVLAVETDVSQIAQVEHLRDAAFDRFGDVGLLMNNAAAFVLGRAYRDLEAWEKTISVNLMGVVHGLQAFVPRMIEAGRPGMIVNTGSKQGITNPPGNAAYNAAKAAVKSLTEGLQHELRNHEGGQLTAHLLVPGWTTTGGREHQPGAWHAEQVAEFLVEALRAGDFYILCPDGDVTPEMDRKRILWAAMDITENRPPLSRWHPEYAADFERFEP